jgi:hypothetical protein
MLDQSLNVPIRTPQIAEGIYVCSKISKRTGGAAISVYQNNVCCQYVGGSECLTDKEEISMEDYLREEVLKESPFPHGRRCFVWASARARHLSLTSLECTPEESMGRNSWRGWKEKPC